MELRHHARGRHLLAQHPRAHPSRRAHAIGHLTVGFTKCRGTSDLFAGNRRLRRVRVRHPGGEVLATLNSEEQRLQRIPVTGEAGDYEIEILEWVAGARPTWRELCISEIRVMGVAEASAPVGLRPRRRCWACCRAPWWPLPWRRGPRRQPARG
ncbi:MAG: hypothetical protein IPI43_32410 [Sandaracinaceae bacterium]|nr:hypothetical protein [Sandaracinaceae bacterium]